MVLVKGGEGAQREHVPTHVKADILSGLCVIVIILKQNEKKSTLTVLTVSYTIYIFYFFSPVIHSHLCHIPCSSLLYHALTAVDKAVVKSTVHS